MLSIEEPADFRPRLIAASCMVECAGRLLFLRRPPGHRYEYRWGCPAGKKRANETPLQAAVRELGEETGIWAAESALHYCGMRFVRYPNDQDFIYHQFWLPLIEEPVVRINPREHDSFRWCTREEALVIGYLGEKDDIRECLNMIP